MKKFLSCIAAAVIGFGIMATPICAAADKGKKDEKDSKAAETEVVEEKRNATMCLDTSKALDVMYTFGAVEDSNFSYEISAGKARTGRSLAVKEDYSGVLASGQENAGISIDAASFGLENFSGCKITLYAYPMASGADELAFYTDGDVYLCSEVELTASPRWTKVTLDVPDTIRNDIFGLMVTSSTGVDGVVCYVDDIEITDADGNPIDNIGDYSNAYGQTTSAGPSTSTVVVFVILIVAVIGVSLYYIFRNMFIYR